MIGTGQRAANDEERRMMKMSRKLLKVFFLILMAGVLALTAVSALAEETGIASGETKEAADELCAVVKTTPYGRINVRSGPGADTARVGVAEPGTKVKVLKNLGKWALIDAASTTAYGTFGVDGVAAELALDEQIAGTGTACDGWGFTLDGSVLKFKQLA